VVDYFLELVNDEELIPHLVFDYVTIYHSKMKGSEFNVKNIKNFRIEWR